MATITLKGNPIHTYSDLPAKGCKAPAFKLVKNDLSEVTLENVIGKKIILNIFPSLDTPVCAMSVRKFNADAAGLATVLCISKDLPFAFSRFCAAEGISNVIPLSAFRDHDFEKQYGVGITDGPLAGLLSRAIVVLDKEGNVSYTEQVPEITQEPDYEKALNALK